MSVELRIKSATQSVEDFVLHCEMTWTIAQVKDQISLLYPTKPVREHQKLIYGGKLLPDHLSLKSVLNQTQDIHILHLVCPLPFSTPTIKKSDENQKQTSNVCPVPQSPAPAVYPQQVFPSSFPTGLYNNPVFPDGNQQYLAMQQMYSQFMTQYIAQFNGSLPYGTTITNTPTSQQPPAEPVRQNVPPVVPPRQNDREEPDYIDALYALSRAAMFAALLVYYSSVTRITVVFITILLLTLIVKVNRLYQREETRRRNERRQAEQEAINDEQNSVAEQENNSESTETTPENNPNQTTTSVPATIVTLIIAFFSSLIPSDPLPVNVN